MGSSNPATSLVSIHLLRGAGGCNANRTLSLTGAIQALAFHSLDNVMPCHDFTKDNVFAVEVRSRNKLRELDEPHLMRS